MDWQDKSIVEKKIAESIEIMKKIIEFIQFKKYDKIFANHHSISEADRQDYIYKIKYRAIYHNPKIIFCNNSINSYQFKRYSDEYKASKRIKPTLFEKKTNRTTRQVFEQFINEVEATVKSWYIDKYKEINHFILDKKHEYKAIYCFNNENIKFIAFQSPVDDS